MDDALILEKLDSLSKEIRSLKSGVLEELKQDLLPIIKQASPHVVDFFSDIEGQYSNEQLVLLIKNLLANVQNLNSMLGSLKAGLELKDDLAPVVKQVLPKTTEFFNEIDGQFTTGDVTDLFRKTLTNLNNFNESLDVLKAGMELKNDLGPVVKQVLPKAANFFSELDGQFDTEDLSDLLRNTLLNLKNFNSALGMLNAGMGLKEDLGPVVKQALPRAVEFFNELEGQFEVTDLTTLFRKTLINLNNFNEALDLLKAGMELKNDLGPVVKQVLPKAQEFFAAMEGQFDPSELVCLLQKTLTNLHNFNFALDLLKSSVELKEDMLPVMQQALPKVQSFLHGVTDHAAVKVGGAVMAAVQKIDCNDEQIQRMCQVIQEIDLSKPNSVGPLGAIKYLRDPKVQEAMGATFTILQTVGSLLEICRAPQESK